jgi:hypothetical protein
MWSEQVLTLIVSSGGQSCNKPLFFHFKTGLWSNGLFPVYLWKKNGMRSGILAVVQNHRNRPHPIHIVYHQATRKHQITTQHLLLRISLADALPYQPLDLQVAYFIVYSSSTILTQSIFSSSCGIVIASKWVDEFFYTILQQLVMPTITRQCCTVRTHCHTPLP